MKPDTHFDIATACPELKLGSIATRYPLPVTRYPLPVTRYPLPATSHSLPPRRTSTHGMMSYAKESFTQLGMSPLNSAGGNAWD